MANRAVYISEEEVKVLADMSEVIEVVGKAMEQFSAGKEAGGVVQPVRTSVPVDKHKGLLLTMPAYSQESDALGTKLVTLYSENDAKGLPSHQGIVLVFDGSTGTLKALVGAEELTAIRTAAASACAIKALLPGPPAILCIVGSGHEARSHVRACRELHNYREVRIWGRNKNSAERCARDVGGAVVYESLEKAVSDADVIVTVTMATEPVVLGKWLKLGAVVCCVGACRPDWRELDDELMHDAVVTVDTREGAINESGDIILSKATIYAEIGEIMSGAKPLPKVPDCGKKFYLFKSLGMAVEDVVSAQLVYKKFIEKETDSMYPMK